MTRALKYIFIFVFGLFAQSITAQNWVHAHTCDNGSTWVFVNNRVEMPTNSNPTYLVTVQWKYASEEAKKDLAPKQTIKVYEFSEDFTKYKILESIDYNTANNVINRVTTPSGTINVSPNSIDDIIVKEVQYILSEQYKIDFESATEIQIVEDELQ